MDETCPVSTEGGTRRVQLLRGGGGRGGTLGGDEGGGVAGREARAAVGEALLELLEREEREARLPLPPPPPHVSPRQRAAHAAPAAPTADIRTSSKTEGGPGPGRRLERNRQQLAKLRQLVDERLRAARPRSGSAAARAARRARRHLGFPLPHGATGRPERTRGGARGEPLTTNDLFWSTRVRGAGPGRARAGRRRR